MARRSRSRSRRPAAPKRPARSARKAVARTRSSSEIDAITGHLTAAGKEIWLAAQGGLSTWATAVGYDGGKASPELAAFLRRTNKQAHSLQRTMQKLARGAADSLACGLKSDNPCVSWASAFGLYELGRNAVPVLMRALHDHSTRVRREAVTTLGWIGPAARGAVDELTRALHDHAPRVRKAAAWALADIGPAARKSIPALVAVLRTKDQDVRDAAAAALGRITKSISASPRARRRA
jgi:HEAT repeat protein